jgi:hypothetical protein
VVPDDHQRSTQVVKDGLRDASKKKATDRAKAPGSQDDEVYIGLIGYTSDFSGRIALRQQSLDGIRRILESGRHPRQEFRRFGMTLSLVVIGSPVGLGTPRAAARRDCGLGKYVENAHAGFPHELKHRQETQSGTGSPGTVHRHQDACGLLRPAADDRNGTRRIPSDGQRSAADEESLDDAEPARSDDDQVRTPFLRDVDDSHSGIALDNEGFDLRPPASQHLRSRICSAARPQLKLLS